MKQALRPANRRIGGLMVMAGGLVLALILFIALVVLDLRVAGLAPEADRAEVFAHGFRVSSFWALGTGGTCLVLGFLVWLSGREPSRHGDHDGSA
ncbi:MAG: hypothetical protein AB7S26_04350 [Sandaracinaceae bacterium]